MSTTRALCVTFLILIALGAAAGLAGMLLAPETVAVAPEDAVTALHQNTEYVTWVKTPEQAEATTPARFVVEEPEQFVLPPGENLAKDKKAAASDYTDVYPPRQAVDGRDRTYWEADSFPSWISADLGETRDITTVVAQLPPLRAWGKRTQAMAVSVSEDGENWVCVAERQDYVFDTQIGNAALVAFDAVAARFVRLDIYANTGAKGGQVSELAVFE